MRNAIGLIFEILDPGNDRGNDIIIRSINCLYISQLQLSLLLKYTAGQSFKWN